jgi:hypothetical protein
MIFEIGHGMGIRIGIRARSGIGVGIGPGIGYEMLSGLMASKSHHFGEKSLLLGVLRSIGFNQPCTYGRPFSIVIRFEGVNYILENSCTLCHKSFKHSILLCKIRSSFQDTFFFFFYLEP